MVKKVNKIIVLLIVFLIIVLNTDIVFAVEGLDNWFSTAKAWTKR